MARITECQPCQMGDHKHHHRVVQAVSEGMMGGAVCLCKGECRDRTPQENAERVLGPDLEAFLRAPREPSHG